MKKFIGTKQVSAEPMTYGEAHAKGLIRENAYVSEYDDNPGYLVEYADGYQSWSPANVFEEAYKVAETPLDRVNIEVADLMERADKLGNFIYNQNDGKDFQALGLGTRATLIAQEHMMGAYLKLLCLRESCMAGNIDCQLRDLTFEQVLPLIKEGFAVRRNGWNGKGLMVFKQVPAHIGSDIIPKMQSLPDEAKRLILDSCDHIDYVSQCLIFNPETGEANSWVPSISDVFAHDWELVKESPNNKK